MKQRESPAVNTALVVPFIDLFLVTATDKTCSIQCPALSFSTVPASNRSWAAQPLGGIDTSTAALVSSSSST
jgi:hypothetical protein